MTPQTEQLWLGIDSGGSQLSVAVVANDGEILAEAQAVGSVSQADRHTNDVERLRRLLPALEPFRGYKLLLAGAADEHLALLTAEGWSVERPVSKHFNDVVSHYGLGEMPGNCVVAACGSGYQTVWVDAENNIRWPGEDLVAAVPEWVLHCWAFAELLRLHSRYRYSLPAELQSDDVLAWSQAWKWRRMGEVFASLVGEPDVRAFLLDAAARVVDRYRIFAAATGSPDPPMLQMSGGAIRDDRIWNIIVPALERAGIPFVRLVGSPAAGVVRYQRLYADREAYGWFGSVKPGWLDWSAADWQRHFRDSE